MVLSGGLLCALAQTAPASTQESGPAGIAAQGSDPSQGQTTPAANVNQGQGLVHIVPLGKLPVVPKKAAAPAGAHLTYWGGPVISNTHVVAVFWGSHVDPLITGASGTTSISQFFTDITQSRYFDLLTEYSTVDVQGSGIPAASSSQSIGRGVFDGAVTITPSICPGPAACSLTDGQIATELAAQITAGNLPQPVTDGQGNVNSFYMIYFPPGVTISLDSVTKSCVQFCAYHSNTPATLTPKLVPYGVEPDFEPPSGCSLGCGGNPFVFNNVTEVTSHEMSEAITDALVGSATDTAPPLAWYDPDPVNNPLGEIGDICVGQGEIVSAGNTTYIVQQEFSNLQNDCVSRPPVFQFSPPANGAGPGSAFNMPLTIESSVSLAALPGYTGTVHFTSSDPQAVLPADYTFTAADAGVHTFSFTLSSLGDQTITATDTHSSGFNGAATVSVTNAPDLAITKSHIGNFSSGQAGATYSVTVSNVGHGPTSGTVNVADTLPGGLTATAISGTGWSCTLGTLSCTRADALAAGSSYPVLTVTVNVAVNAPSLVTNTASVSGGGESNTANDSASDPTSITIPDLVISEIHFGPINGNFFQGETGATYSIFINNIGNQATSGTVTVVDTLPTGLTATSISGTGWTCTLNTLTCTRGDSLAGNGAAYDLITLTVNVALDAPASVTNTVTVSGGGEVNTGNDTAHDTATVLPPPIPDLAISKSHSGAFIQGLSGTYSITVTNVGTANSSGTVTVTDSLPAGLTATALSGANWSCTLATLTCSRADTLLFNNSYPPILLTVDIAANAPASVTNTASVSGGGETNTANNIASDLTMIASPLVDLQPIINPPIPETQGLFNQNYLVVINNVGNTASGGTVTVVNSLSTGLTATAISGGGWTCTLNNLTCTRSDVVNGGGNFSSINITFNVDSHAPATGQLSATVSGGGDGNAANNTTVLPLTINPAITISGPSAPVVVSAGQSALFTLNIQALGPVGPVNLSCTGLPAASACNFSPQTVQPGFSGVLLTITTTARSVAGGTDTPGRQLPLWPALALSFMMMVGFYRRLRNQGSPRTLKPVMGLAGLLLACTLVVAGCGGGSSPPPSTITGTAAGTYTITITGTAPTNTASSQVTLTVR